MDELLLAKKLVEELKKPGREFIYDKNDSSHKNNHKKTIVWTEISKVVGIDSMFCVLIYECN